MGILGSRTFFSGEAPSYKTVFHHYRKWCKLGEWEKMFAALVKKYKHLLDLSLSHIDGSHTPAARGGESVDNQGWKKRKTTNALYFSDRQGLPLTMSEPQKGNHTDLYEIEARIDEMAVQLKNAGKKLPKKIKSKAERDRHANRLLKQILIIED